MALIYLSLGSNVKPKSDFLRKAESFIEQYIGQIVQRSSDYETAPWGVTDQESFINNVLLVETYHNPHIVLSSIDKIEFSIGRERQRKWGERKIDIDILFYDNIIVDTVNLKIPHPLIAERNFVLAPMQEINHMFIHPIFHKTIEELYLASSDQSAVRIIG